MQIDPTSCSGMRFLESLRPVLVHYPQQLASSGKRAAMNMRLGFMKIVLLHDFYR
ncbi:hypothetical protein SAMN05216404_101302 [Nitrosospira multiformis]|uniref:Uncharacterized protein n=1 Tax=Nitrosospira multiformis TaxID=1231 RepID=A0A1H8BQ82_9PROT|nr:hypothetical protein SAMN05216404_101302 [Nitrosospira multiformis]